MQEILTPRLVLRTMPETFLEACLRDDLEQAREIIGLSLTPEWFEAKPFMAIRLGDCQADAEYRPWSVRAIGLRSAAVMAGYIGFHSKPNAAYLQAFVDEGVELGYTVFSMYRRQGIAEEAIRGMMGWAARDHGVRQFVVSIAPTNAPSLALARKLGFRKIGEHTDEIDGLEEVFLRAGPTLDDLSEPATAPIT